MTARQIRTHFFSATAFGLLGGLLDGLQQFVLRIDPIVRASQKVGADVLWAGPATALVFLLAAAIVSLPVIALLSHWRPQWASRASHSAFAALAAWLAATSTDRVVDLAVYVLVGGIALRVLIASNRTVDRMDRLALRGSVLLVAAVALCFGGVTGWQRIRLWRAESALAAASPESPNVIIVVLDTFRRDLLVGTRRITLMPNVARLRARGIEFADAWATSTWSLASQASILTGMFPNEHGADWPALRYADSVRPLPQRLAEKGYATGAFSGNFSWVTPEYLGRGFLDFVSYNTMHVLFNTSAARHARRRRWIDDREIDTPARPARQLQADVLRFIDRHRSRPFFVYVCFMDANHAIYDTQRRLVGKRKTYPTRSEQRAISAGVVKSYRQSAMNLDGALGALLDSLDRRGRLDNTLVVLTSDHGESFGAYVADDHGPAGHATSLYPEQARVPLIVAGAGVATPGVVVTRPVSLRDIGATVGEVVGIETPGRSLLALARDSTHESSPVVVTLLYHDRQLRGIVGPEYFYFEDGWPTVSKREVTDRRDSSALGKPMPNPPANLLDSLSRELRTHLTAR